MSDQHDPIVIVAAKRTAVGAFSGTLADTPAHQLGAVAIKAALADCCVSPSEVDEVVMGQILTAGMGQGPARQAAMAAGIPQEKTAYSINQLCGSGLRAVALGFQAIATGDASVMVCGGQESMSLAPHCMNLRTPTKMGDASMTDTMIKDGLWDAFNGYHMGVTAENIAAKWNVTRADQDAFAAASQQKTEAAQKAGKFVAEIAPVTIRRKKEEIVFDRDEFPRAGVTAEALGALRPAFKSDGSVTAGNASGLNDGAAALVLMRGSEAKKRGLKPFAKIASWATAGVDPAVMGTGPIPASKQALAKAGWSVGDLDLVESNEAFAAPARCVVKEQGLGEARIAVGVVGGQVDLTLMDGALHLGQLELGLDEATMAPGGLPLRLSAATLRPRG